MINDFTEYIILMHSFKMGVHFLLDDLEAYSLGGNFFITSLFVEDDSTWEASLAINAIMIKLIMVSSFNTTIIKIFGFVSLGLLEFIA